MILSKSLSVLKKIKILDLGKSLSASKVQIQLVIQ